MSKIARQARLSSNSEQQNEDQGIARGRSRVAGRSNMDVGSFGSGGANADYRGSKRAAWAVFALTCLLMVFDFIDRQIIVAMLPFIKSEWGLSDTQLGGLISIVSLTVGLFSIPVALLADRWSRVKSIFAMAFVWSAATIACAFAGSFVQLLALRGLVGIGEAGYGGAGAALLSSRFPARMRAGILGAFTASAAIGAVLGVVLGGAIATRWGWHAAFGIVGLPGLILAFLYLLVKDYETVDLAATAGEAKPKFSLGEIVRIVLNSPSALAIYIGGALQLFVVSTIYSWLPSFFNREYGLAVDQAGARAAVVLLAGSVAAVAWGWLADRAGRDAPANKILIMAVSAVSSSVVLITAFGAFAPGSAQFALILLGAVLMTGTIGTVAAVTIDVAHPGLRATAIAIGALIQNLFGLAGGPFITGVISDKYGLVASLAVVPAFGLLAAVAFVMTIGLYRKDLGGAQRVELQQAALVVETR
jgi:MFS transporter, Spinster family, sphingosine-1-phosphate transporter